MTGTTGADEPKARRGGILRSVLGVGGVQAVSVPLLLAVSIVFARLLGPEDFGRFAFALSLGNLLALPAGRGVGPLITREVARGITDGSPGLVIGLRKRTRQLHLVFSALMVLVVPYFAFGIGSPALATAGLLGAILSRYYIDSGFIRGMHKPVLSQVALNVVRPISVLAVAMIVWLLFGIELPEALASQVVGTVLGLVVSLWFTRQALASVDRHAEALFKDREWMRSYLPFVITTGMGFLNVEIGILLLTAISDPEGASGMRIAQNAGQLVILPLMAVNMVVQPKLAALARATDKGALLSTYINGAKLALLGSLALGVPVIVLAEPLVRIAFGGDYVPLAANAIRVLVVGQILSSTIGPSGTFLGMIGKERLGTYAHLSGLLVAVVFVLLLAPALSATGAALGITAGLLVKNGAEAVFLRMIQGSWLFAFARPK